MSLKSVPLGQFAELPVDGRQSQTALKIARGTARLLHAHGYCVPSELPLASGRRADPGGALATTARSGSSRSSPRSRTSAPTRSGWISRLHCDRLFFATTVEVPCEIFPPDTGLIVGRCAFGAQIVCEAPEHRLHAATRKSMTLSIARAPPRCALQSLADPAGPYQGEFSVVHWPTSVSPRPAKWLRICSGRTAVNGSIDQNLEDLQLVHACVGNRTRATMPTAQSESLLRKSNAARFAAGTASPGA